VVNASDRAAFEAGNAHGTRNLIDAVRQSGTKRLIHVSSLAAREPDLSDYGWSKQMAERHVMASGLDWTILRPPAVYGPEDGEMLELFRMAQRGFLVLPPEGRLSIIEVTDLAHALLALAEDRTETIAHTYEVDDGTPGGWSHRDLGKAIATAVGRNAHIMAAPRWLLMAAAQVDRAVRRSKAKLTPDRARYFCHPDWVVDADKGVSAAIWRPAVDTAGGLAATVRAYRAKGWL
jgi:nucleoside-diphosphate-sugar epimerase